jgi:hypothetical protein
MSRKGEPGTAEATRRGAIGGLAVFREAVRDVEVARSPRGALREAPTEVIRFENVF